MYRTQQPRSLGFKPAGYAAPALTPTFTKTKAADSQGRSSSGQRGLDAWVTAHSGAHDYGRPLSEHHHRPEHGLPRPRARGGKPPSCRVSARRAEQVCGAITFYLANKEEVERDMVERRRIEEEVIKAQPPLAPELQQKLERARERMLSRDDR